MKLETLKRLFSYRAWLARRKVFSMPECIFQYCPHPARCVISCKNKQEAAPSAE